MPTFGYEEFDLVLTDPPYNVGREYGNGINDNLSPPRYEQFSKQWLSIAKRVGKTIVFTAGAINLSFWSKTEKPTWICIWVNKNSLSPSALGGFTVYDPILIYKRPKKRIPLDVFYQPIFKQKDVANHPNPKPLKLFMKLVEIFSESGDIVLDPFLGTGTTMIACKKLGRSCIGIEMNPDYVKIAEERLAKTMVNKKLAEAFA